MGNLGLISPPCPQAVSIQNPYLFYNTKNTGRLSFTDQLWLFFLKRHFKRQLPATDLVFCQTATMQERLRTIFGYKGRAAVTSKVVSAFSASMAADGKPPAPISPFAGKYKLFYLARYYPHKGLEVLVEVMDQYREELADTIAVITIAPEQHKNAARLLDRIKRCGLQDRIINVGPLKQEQLADYYVSCDCLVMPTRLESFSGTYLESMHFGLPILTSDLDFAREVCSDAALYFDPWNAESIKDAILRLKNDPDLRKTLVERGRVRLSQSFGRTWQDVAKEMKKGLESLVAPRAK
jgi:glycosyltransferase involved in cell wall biosynthesis